MAEIIKNVFRSRRRTGVAAVVAVIAFMGSLAAAAPMGGLPAAGGTAGGGAGDVPGGYASWAALFAVQSRMNNEAQLLRAVAGQSSASGFAGVIAAPDEHALVVYWHGGLSPEARAVLAQSSVPVTVRPAPHTASEVQAEAERVVAGIKRTPGTIVTSVAVPPDGTSVTVTISGTQADVAGVRRQLGATTVPLTIVTGGQPDQELSGGPPPRSRWNDPSAGGAAMAPSCTLGFTIYRNQQHQMLTALHCFPKGSGSDRYTINDKGGQGSKFGTLASVPAVNRGITVDAAAIKPVAGTEFRGYVWRGVNGDATGRGQSKMRVSGAAVPQVGNYVCTSGARSGEICNIKVTERFDSYIAEGPDGKTLYGPGWQALAPSGTSAAGRGDSGGPVYLDNQREPGSGPSGGVTAVGIISAGTVRKPCKGVQGRFCFRSLTFVGIDDALHALGNAAIVTSNGNKTFPSRTRPATAPQPGYPIHDELIDANGLSIDADLKVGLIPTPNIAAPGDEWVFTGAGNGSWNIRWAQVNIWLEDFGPNGQVFPNGQNWRLASLGDGWTQIINAADGRCLDTAAAIGQLTRICDSADPSQRFQLVEVESDDHDTATPIPGYTPPPGTAAAARIHGAALAGKS